MNNNIAYLVQTSDYIPDFVQTLEDMERDVYLLSYKKPIAHKNNIFFPDSTCYSGRNKLAEIVPKKYLYYVFLDDDIKLHIRKERYPNESSNPWKIFDDFLLKHEPAIGGVYCNSTHPKARFRHYLDDSKKINTIKEHEPIISAVHREALDLCFPVCLKFDEAHKPWCWTASLYILITKIAFGIHASILQCNKLALENSLHRERHRGGLDTNILFWMFANSLLNKGDKKETYLEFSYENDSVPDDYEKPYPYKYKKMIDRFKNEVDKDHFLWKYHPFINE